jgi:DNA-binding transcriptional MerR regulator
MSGISARTLRHYDDIGLLKPKRIAESGYRIYSRDEVDTLQQILIYKELGFSLSDIKTLLDSPEFSHELTFSSHLSELHKKRAQLDALIANVTKSIAAMRGEILMSDKEKFEGLKQNLIDENEAKYGEEIRAKYGDNTIDSSNAKIKGLTKEQYDEVQRLSDELNDTLKAAVEQGDPTSDLAQKACELHKRWLCYFWDSYTKDMHRGIAQMYVDDPRFSAYYDKIVPGCAVFLRDAILVYCEDK